jgi:glucans biosynthesis protein
MHGGAEGSGAPKGNNNALKQGLYTRKALEERRRLRRLIAEARKTLKELA